MTSHCFPRRLLLVATILAGLALAPQAEARVRPAAQPPSRSWETGDLAGFLRHLFHSLWGKAGSSMDPLGNH